MAVDKRKALGRGLGALIPSSAPTQSSDAAAVHTQPVTGVSSSRREFFICPIEDIAPSRDNPRQRFDDQRLNELADSIRVQGLVQPLVVRQRTADEEKGTSDARYILIAGERRWRAAQRAGLKDIPVVVKEVSAASAFELALVENLQREDLNPIEEAEAYRRLSDEFGYSQEQLAQRVGRERSTIANSLRLLKLSGKARELVTAGQLSMGHARALLGLATAAEIDTAAEHVLAKQLSVRQTEGLVRRAQREPTGGGDSASSKPGTAEPARKSASVRDVEERLQRALGTRVRLLETSKSTGHIEVQYHSLDELDRLIAHFTSGADDSSAPDA